MSHLPDCPPTGALATPRALREWMRKGWPQGSPIQVSVAGLNATNQAGTAVRVPTCSDAPWLAFLGQFSGLVIGMGTPNGANQSPLQIPIVPGAVIPAVFGDDLFLWQDTSGSGGVGTVTLAAFRTREEAQAWAVPRSPGAPGGSGAGASTNWADSKSATVTAPPAVSFAELLNTNTGLADRAQAIPTAAPTGRAKVEYSAKPANVNTPNASTAAGGVISSYTCPAGKIAEVSSFTASHTTGAGTVGLVVRWTPSGGSVSQLFIASLAIATSALWSPVNLTLAAGDEVEWFVSTAVGGTNCDFAIFVRELYAE